MILERCEEIEKREYEQNKKCAYFCYKQKAGSKKSIWIDYVHLINTLQQPDVPP